ncbi:MAG: ATP synthase F1 subunit epsilon [Defluviitaleaceae bacterium]|nr:ATP synthase F1 subunit epsilon [Defluviitaleaceae bacterium]
MPNRRLTLKIATPDELKVNEPVDMVIMRADTGALGVLPGHEPRSLVLDYGVLRLFNEKRERRIAVFGGIAEILDDEITILTPEAYWPVDIDIRRAEADRENAERRLREKQDDMEIASDQVMLRRALVQIEVSSYTIVSDSEKLDNPL